MHKKAPVSPKKIFPGMEKVNIRRKISRLHAGAVPGRSWQKTSLSFFVHSKSFFWFPGTVFPQTIRKLLITTSKSFQ
jgi:hypothetical protein